MKSPDSEPDQRDSDQDVGDDSNRSRPPASLYVKYSTLGLQFGVALVLFVFIGQWLDERFGWEPWGTLLGSGMGFVGASFWLYYKVYGKPVDRRPGSANTAASESETEDRS